ncbi:MAG: hypothetical protein ABIW76_23860 [Fibrobacteria bacterium]
MPFAPSHSFPKPMRVRFHFLPSSFPIQPVAPTASRFSGGIGYTPDIKEWLDGGTRAQAYDISGRLVTEWGKNLKDAAAKQVDEITDYFNKIF